MIAYLLAVLLTPAPGAPAFEQFCQEHRAGHFVSVVYMPTRQDLGHGSTAQVTRIEVIECAKRYYQRKPGPRLQWTPIPDYGAGKPN